MNKTKRSARTPNEIVKYDDYAEIILYDKDCEEIARAIIDIDDIEKCSLYKWSYKKDNKYVKNGHAGYLHRYIMEYPENMVVDHINGNKLDNRKSNLRICTDQQNKMNHKTYSNNSAGYPGVSWHKKSGKWRARIQVQGKDIHLGFFDVLEDAIHVRHQAEIDYFGEFAPHLNDNKEE